MSRDVERRGDPEGSGDSKPKRLSLRAQGKAPRANYVIKPVAGSLFGNAAFLRDDPERAHAVVDRMLANSGARRSGTGRD